MFNIEKYSKSPARVFIIILSRCMIWYDQIVTWLSSQDICVIQDSVSILWYNRYINDIVHIWKCHCIHIPRKCWNFIKLLWFLMFNQTKIVNTYLAIVSPMMNLTETGSVRISNCFPLSLSRSATVMLKVYFVNIMSSIMTHNNYVENASLTLMD